MTHETGHSRHRIADTDCRPYSTSILSNPGYKRNSAISAAVFYKAGFNGSQEGKIRLVIILQTGPNLLEFADLFEFRREAFEGLFAGGTGFLLTGIPLA